MSFAHFAFCGHSTCYFLECHFKKICILMSVTDLIHFFESVFVLQDFIVRNKERLINSISYCNFYPKYLGKWKKNDAPF